MTTQDILNGTPFTLDEEREMDFLLEFQKNWNDYGYRTWFTLKLFIPQYKYSYRIADFYIFNKGQKVREIPSWNPTSYVAYISDDVSSERLFRFLSPIQRRNLEDLLKLSYDYSDVQDESVFNTSVLRNRSLEEIIKQQKYAKELVHSSLNASQMLINIKDEMRHYLHVVKK